MKVKLITGSAIAATILAVGIVAGGVVGSDSASAQTPAATATATTDAPSAAKVPGALDGGRGGRGMGGDLGRGGGKDGLRGATAEGATSSISNTTTVINLAKADLAYATGKMDTAAVQRWISGAEQLLRSAQTSNNSSQYGQAVAYAGAARELAMTAISQMGQELGADTPPSYSQLPQGRHGRESTATAAEVTQAQASRHLAHTYNNLVMTGAVADRASNASQAQAYLTEAEAAYRAAYDAYGAGNYSQAVQSARLAERLMHVASGIVRAGVAPANADTPVTVPAPNF
jgi:HEPN domain-containing protein